MWKALFKKEFFGYFNNYSTYFIMAVYAALSILSAFYVGLYFISDNPSMFSFFIFQPQIMSLIIPAITMKAWAEEQKSGSLELLFSYPLSVFCMVSAKVIAAYVVVFIMILFSIPLMVSSAFIVELDYLTIASSYLGMLLLCLFFVGLGCCVSAACKQPIVAYLLAAFLGWIFISFEYSVDSSSLPYYISSSFSLMSQYSSLLNGQVGVYPLFYFVFGFVCFVLLNYVLISQRNDRNKKVYIAVFALILLSIFVVLSLLVNVSLGKKYFDLSKNEKYTLADVSGEVVEKIAGPIDFQLYISEDYRSLSLENRAYAEYVISTLGRYADSSQEKISLDVRTVAPYSAMQKNADNEGIVPKVVDDLQLYLGLNVLQDGKSVGKIPFFEPKRAAYLENDINRILFMLGKKKPKLALVAPNLPILDKRGEQKWSIVPLLRENYQLVELDDHKSHIPFDVDVLLLINPMKVSDVFIYALDQYLMRGGKMIVFVDPYSEVLQKHLGYPPKNVADLTRLLDNSGIKYDNSLVVGDEKTAQYVTAGANREFKKYPLWFYAQDEQGRDLAFRTPAALTINEEKAAPLLKTSHEGGVVGAKDLRYLPKDKVFALYQPKKQAYVIAAKSFGDIYSIHKENPWEGMEYEDKIPPFLPIAIKKPSLVVVADSDFVADDNWVLSKDDENPVYGVVPYSQNADFVLATVDEMLGGREVLLKNILRTSLSKANILDEMYDDEYLPKAQALSSLEAVILRTGVDVDALKSRLRNLPHAEDLPIYRELEDLEVAYGKKVKELDEMRFVIERNVRKKLDLFVAMNLVLFPLLMLLFVSGMLVLYRRFARKY